MSDSAMHKKYGDLGNREEVEDKYARLIARVWADPEFSTRLVAHPVETLEEFDMGVGPGKDLKVVIGTSGIDYWILPAEPHADDKASIPIVQPPAWYQAIIEKAWHDAAFKRLLLANPRDAAKTFGVKWPATRTLKVLEDTDQLTHFLVPAKPLAEGDELSDELLESVAGGMGAAMQPVRSSSFNQPQFSNVQFQCTTGVRG